MEAVFDAAAIDAIFGDIDQCQLPGAAVAIAIGGVPVYRKGFGLANLELPALLAPTMRMRIGSTTKHFAALAYLLLCEDGRAGLDDEIGHHLPELHQASRHATMRQLMGHVSGLRDVFDLSMQLQGAGRTLTDRQMLAFYETIDDIDFEPETNWSYNNGGYLMLSAAIERITDETLDDVLRKRIFAPIGMIDTLLRRWDGDFVPNSATLHMKLPDGDYTRDYMGMEISGAGGIVSTMDDMLRWLKHMDAPLVGSAETWALMRTPQRLRNGTSTGYGLGLMTGAYRGVATVHHGGGVMGGNSQMIKVPAAGLDISIAVNRSDLSAATLASRVIDACVPGLEAVPEAPDGKTATGIFRSPDTGRVIELSAKDGSQILNANGMPTPMVRGGDSVYRLPPEMAFLQLALDIGDEDAPISVRLSSFGIDDILVRIEPEPEVRLGDLAGNYACPAIGVTARLFEEDGQARMTTSGPHGSHDLGLTPLGPDTWKASSLGPFAILGGTLAFIGKDGFRFTTGRTNALPFRRMR